MQLIELVKLMSGVVGNGGWRIVTLHLTVIRDGLKQLLGKFDRVEVSLNTLNIEIAKIVTKQDHHKDKFKSLDSNIERGFVGGPAKGLPFASN